MAIVRAARALGHPAAWWTSPAGTGDSAAWPMRSLVRRLAEGFRPDAVIFTRHAHHAGARAHGQELSAGRAGGVWYFDYAPTPAPELLALARAAGSAATSPVARRSTPTARPGCPRCSSCPRRWIRPTIGPRRPRPVALPLRPLLRRLGPVSPTVTQLLRRLAGVGRLQIRGPGWEQVRRDLPVAGGPVWGADSLGWSAARPSRSAPTPSPDRSARPACDSNRIWKVLGCGGFYLGPWQPGSDAFARHGEHCAWYRDADEAVAARDAATWLRPSERARIAAAGRAHALSGAYLRPSPPLAARGAVVTRWCSCGTRTRGRRSAARSSPRRSSGGWCHWNRRGAITRSGSSSRALDPRPRHRRVAASERLDARDPGQQRQPLVRVAPGVHRLARARASPAAPAPGAPTRSGTSPRR